MIKTKQILKSARQCSCDNCNRPMNFVIEYTFQDKEGKEYNKITLCEDCANAVTTLLRKTMEEGESYKYEKDEFRKIPKTIEELGEDLCDYCLLDESDKGVHNYGHGPIFCHESGHCDKAYEAYLEECEEEI